MSGDAELTRIFQATLSGAQANAATQELERLGTTQLGFPVMVLRYLATSGLPIDIGQAAAAFFKNFVKKRWVPDPDDGKDFISAEDRKQIKTHIVGLMLRSPPKIQQLLSEALGIISKVDFPRHWDNLLPELVAKLKTDNFDEIKGVLTTANSIFYRYRHEMKSQTLWEEVAIAVTAFAEPLTALYKRTLGMIPGVMTNGPALTQVFQLLNLQIQIALSLNSQDVVSYWQDHMDDWFQPFFALLEFNSDLVKGKDNETPSALDDTKTSVLEMTCLFVDKYEEDVQKFVQSFTEKSFALLTTLTENARYDQLVNTAMHLLTSIVKKEDNKQFFAKEEIMKALCERVVIPQIKLRDADMELFNDNGLEYIRRDMEGSDVDTRRRTTVELVRALARQFEEGVSTMLTKYVSLLMADYASAPATKWTMKDAAMYIILAIAIQGKTAKGGVTKVSPYVKIMDFFGEHVLPELKGDDIDSRPVLRADCIKFVIEFRSQIPVAGYTILLPMLIKYLNAESFVLHTYAASCIERLLSDKDEKTGAPKFGKSDVAPHIEPLLKGLFAVLEKDGSEENEYVMKAIMRVTSVAQETILPFVQGIIAKAGAILANVAKNPKVPIFNHYVFETLASLIKHICQAKPETVGHFESALFPILTAMLGMDTCTEFQPYIFQLMACMLSFRTSLVDLYKGLFVNLLSPALYENLGNVPALTYLIGQYCIKAPDLVLANIEPVLGVFQKLIASIKTDHDGITLICTVLEHIPMAGLMKFIVPIFNVMFTRMKVRASDKFKGLIAVYLAHFASKHGFATLVQALNAIQPSMADMIIGNVMIPAIPNVSVDVHKKTIACGVVAMLLRTPEFQQVPWVDKWPLLLQSTIQMYEAPIIPGDDEDDLLEITMKSFNTTFAKLAFAGMKEFDPNPSVAGNGRDYLVNQLKAVAPQVGPLVGKISPVAQAALSKYLAA